MTQAKQNSFGSVFSADVLEFVSVSTDFCAFLEQSGAEDATSFCNKALKLLPQVYMKGLSLSAIELNEGDDVEQQVTEEDYNFIRETVAAVLGTNDDYLDVFLEDMKYSDTPILKTVSEDMADIYQDLRNFIAAYGQGLDEVRYAALGEVQRAFRNYWGGRCLSAMRALHEIKYTLLPDEGE